MLYCIIGIVIVILVLGVVIFGIEMYNYENDKLSLFARYKFQYGGHKYSIEAIYPERETKIFSIKFNKLQAFNCEFRGNIEECIAKCHRLAMSRIDKSNRENKKLRDYKSQLHHALRNKTLQSVAKLEPKD